MTELKNAAKTSDEARISVPRRRSPCPYQNALERLPVAFFHGQADRSALGKILDPDPDRQSQRRIDGGHFPARKRRAESESDGKPLGDIVDRDRQKHFRRFFERRMHAVLVFAALVRVRNDLIQYDQKRAGPPEIPRPQAPS